MSKLGKVSLTVAVGLALLASLVWANRAVVVLSIFELAVPLDEPRRL